MVGIYQVGEVADKVEVDWWILALGGVGMSIGLATYGYKIIKCLGARMAAMSCTRGYCIQLSSATTIKPQTVASPDAGKCCLLEGSFKNLFKEFSLFIPITDS